jgi:hypothetical protein
MNTIANVRIHRETHKQPLELFASEKQYLKPLPTLPADTGVIRTVRASNRFRVVVDTNRYSVPSLYASQRLLLKTFADRLCIYHGEKLIATHTRSYDRYQDFENPEHVRELLERRRAARDAKLLLSFYALCSRAEEYHRQLQERRLSPRLHIAKIMALSQIYGPDKVARAIEDAFEFQAFSSDYIAIILEQRERFTPPPGPLSAARIAAKQGLSSSVSSRMRLAAEGQTSLGERWDAGMTDIPYFVLVFDEFADLILSDRDAKKAFEELVARLAAKGRAAGIHLLLATQRPDRNVVTGLIKANLPLKICLKVTSTMNSQIVLDEPGAEQLLGRGDLLYNAGRGLVRAQSYFIPQPEFLKLCLPDK